MTIYISATQYFCCVEILFEISKPFFKRCYSKSETYVFFIADVIFNIYSMYWIWGLALISRRTSISYSTVASIVVVILGWSNNLLVPAIFDGILLMQLLLIFKLFLLKICLTCSFSEKVSLASLKISYWCLFLH